MAKTPSLRSRCKKAGISQGVLAAVTGINPSTIGTYYSGKVAPGIANQALIDVAFSGSPTATAAIDAAKAEIADSATKGRTKGGRRSIEFERYFEGLPVRDAKVATRVMVLPEDVDPAARKEPMHCALAKACSRMYGSKTVLFFKTLAYVELIEEDGTRVVERFMLGKAAATIVEAFDKGEDIPTDGRLVALEPPTPGKTLEHGRKAKRARNRGEYKAPLHRERARKAAETRAKKSPIDVRSGTGQFPMVPAP